MRNLLREESDIFREYRRYKIGAFIVVALIPMFYACIFLGSIWDPFQHLKNLPVAYANEDSGMIFRNKEVHLGADVMKEFIARGIFSFREYPSAEAARAAVRMGDVYFALVLPKDFSEKSLVGSKENPGLIHLILSEGLGFTAAMIGQRVGNELTHKLNERLNQRRWEIVFSEQDHAGKSLQSLQYALRKLSDGTKKNLDGQEKFNKYFQELNKGIKKTEEGNASLLDGIRKYKDESSKILLVGSALGEGAHKIEVGIEKMGTGISQISEGSDKLLLASNELNYAAKEIFLGTNLIYQHLPKHLQPLVGDAQGLSASVEIERESLSENASYGTAFTPYFVALSLWLGIVVSTFFFHYRKIRETSRNNPQWKKICIKLFFPSIMVIFQALLCCIGVIYWLHLTAQSMIAFVFISLQASLIFLCIIFSFILIFRDAGRLVALLFFVFQIASAGGAFPIEMSGAIYRIASPWLPFTNIVKAMRVAVLGAYNGSYALFLLKAWLVTGMLFIIANLISRWKYVSNSEYSLAIDI